MATQGCDPLSLLDSSSPARSGRKRPPRRTTPKLPKIWLKSPACARDAEANVRSVLEPGDVVTIAEWAPLPVFWLRFAYGQIRRNQKKIFGNQSNWYDTHCMLYLDEKHTLSVQFPVNLWRTPKDYCKERISIYRFTKHSPFAPDEVAAMKEYFETYLLGVRYNIGELIDIRLSNIFGFRNQLHALLFGNVNRRHTVCSVGVREVLEALGQKLNQCGRNGFGTLFRKPNALAAWPGGVFPQSRDPSSYAVDLWVTAPAHFANSSHYDNEFELIAMFDQGYRVY